MKNSKLLTQRNIVLFQNAMYPKRQAKTACITQNKHLEPNKLTVKTLHIMHKMYMEQVHTIPLKIFKLHIFLFCSAVHCNCTENNLWNTV